MLDDDLEDNVNIKDKDNKKEKWNAYIRNYRKKIKEKEIDRDKNIIDVIQKFEDENISLKNENKKLCHIINDLKENVKKLQKAYIEK